MFKRKPKGKNRVLAMFKGNYLILVRMTILVLPKIKFLKTYFLITFFKFQITYLVPTKLPIFYYINYFKTLKMKLYLIIFKYYITLTCLKNWLF
jgi:hypothetical protein